MMRLEKAVVFLVKQLLEKYPKKSAEPNLMIRRTVIPLVAVLEKEIARGKRRAFEEARRVE